MLEVLAHGRRRDPEQASRLGGQAGLAQHRLRRIECGQAIADALALNGAKVAYADIDFDAAKKTAAKTRGALALRLDVANEMEINQALEELLLAVRNASLEDRVSRSRTVGAGSR